jgi:cysteine-rich repeat protein
MCAWVWHPFFVGQFAVTRRAHLLAAWCAFAICCVPNGKNRCHPPCEGGTLCVDGACAALCDDDHRCVGEYVCREGICRSTNPDVPVCGDGVVQGNELCDDGNQTLTDACPDGPGGTCRPAACGDGFLYVQAEACDDGNRVDTDACTNLCRLSSCGDGEIEPPEVCDDGNMDNTDACLNTCLAASCGDSLVRAGEEECDGGEIANGECVGCAVACASDFGDCNDGIADGCEASLLTDGANCARCAHSCQGGACDAGVCQPWMFADIASTDDPDPRPTDIAMDVAYAYWCTQGGNVMRIDRASHDVATLATGQGWISAIAVDDSRVYWVGYDYDDASCTTCGAARSIPKTGGEAPTTIMPLDVPPRSIAVNDSRVCWSASTIYCADKHGGDPVAISGSDSEIDMAIDATHVYWVAWTGGGGSTPITGPVSRWDGVVTQVISSGETHPQGLAIDDAYVYWTTLTTSGGETTATLKRAKKGGCTEACVESLHTVAGSASTNAWLEVDASNIYALFSQRPSYGPSVLVRIDTITKNFAEIQNAMSETFGLAIDNRSVAWMFGNSDGWPLDQLCAAGHPCQIWLLAK